MKGGEFIGRGTYGCVFRPAVACVDGTVHKKVGKVFFDATGYNDEKKIAKVLEKVDPAQDFLLYPADRKCVVSKNDVSKEDPYNDCEIHGHYANRFSQMIMEYGGLSMTDYLHALKKKMTRREAARMLCNVFEGVELLCKNRLVHQDIKPDNVVVDSNGLSRLIDFGLLTTFAKFSNNFLFDYEYFVNGPEYRLLLYSRDHAKTLFHLKNNLKNNCFLDAWKRDGLDIVDADYSEGLRRYLEGRSKHMPEKADTYSLGVLTALVQPYLVPAKKDNKAHVKAFNGLVYALLRPDPKDRPSASGAVSMLRRIVSSPMDISPAPAIKNRTPRLVLPPAPTKKECPPGKVLNPATGRCVKADGKIGLALAAPATPMSPAAPAAPAISAASKGCPPGKVLNPATGRCVKADGKIGRALAA